MSTLAHRFAELRKKIGGYREQTRYEDLHFRSPEERQNITPFGKPIFRITGELEFALRLNEVNDHRFEEPIDRALTLLERTMEEEGTLPRTACLTAEKELLPLVDAAKEYTVILAGHAHIDMNWMWTWNETVAVTLATFRTMLDIMDEFPDFHFSQSQASVYRIVEEYDPAMMERIKQRIAEGRWEVTASAWVETDKNMPTTESLLRHIQCTKTYLRDTWGIDPASLEIDFSPDTFGHSANLPEIDALGNVKYYYHCRALSDKDVMLYRWKALSGREMLCYREPLWYNAAILPTLATSAIDKAEACGGLKTSLFLYGVGDHGGGPTRLDLERAQDMMTWPVFPTLKFGSIREYFHAAEAVRDKVPLVDHEINGIFQGCYTTQSRVKMGNRACERALVNAESIHALATAKVGVAPLSAKYEQAWRDTLLTHFHDILTGSCTPESREYAMGLYANVLATTQTQLEQAASAIVREIDTSAIPCDAGTYSPAVGGGAGYGAGTASDMPRSGRGGGRTRIFHVFNPVAIPRDEAVEITVWDWYYDLTRAYFTTADGTPLTCDLVDGQQNGYWGHQFFRAQVKVALPPLGYTTVVLHEAEHGERLPRHYLFHPTCWPDGEYTDRVLENEYLRAVFSTLDGRLISLWDKENGRELLREGESGGLCLIDTQRSGYEAWRIGRYKAIHPFTDNVRLEGGYTRSLQQAFAVEYRMRASTARVTVSLDAGSRALRYHVTADWREITVGDNIPVLAYRLPLAEAPDTYLYDIPGGALARAPFNNDSPGLQYAVANDACGFGAGFVSASKYGYRGQADGTMFATLLNSSDNPDKYPENGRHTIQFYVGVFPTDAKVLEETATALNNQLLYLPATGAHKGTLPTEGAFLQFDSDGCVVTSLAATADGFRVRLFNTKGTASPCTLGLDRPLTAACDVDLLDAVREALPVTDGKLTFEMPPYAVRSILLKV